MKQIIGFGYGSTEELVPAASPQEALEAKRSLVRVRFENCGNSLSYYNDRFCLEPGDRVFVSGSYFGRPGIVESVTTKFKINAAKYERVLSKAVREIHGTYDRALNTMVSTDDNAMTAEEFRTWIISPPADPEEDEEIVCGDGYDLTLTALGQSEEISPAVYDRAVNYCQDGNVAYISVKNGTGKAFIEGTTWYEIDFRLDGDQLSEMYCDCPYPGLCKHLLAVALTIKALSEQCSLDTRKDFVIMNDAWFWRIVTTSKQQITL